MPSPGPALINSPSFFERNPPCGRNRTGTVSNDGQDCPPVGNIFWSQCMRPSEPWRFNFHDLLFFFFSFFFAFSFFSFFLFSSASKINPRAFPRPHPACAGPWPTGLVWWWWEKVQNGGRGILWTRFLEPNARKNAPGDPGPPFLLHGGRLRGLKWKQINSLGAGLY